MISSRAILKGTFRLSIVAAVVAGAYTAFNTWHHNVKSYKDAMDTVFSYECGGQRSDEALNAAVSGTMIDLTEVGCSQDPHFYATFEEIQAARQGTIRRELLSDRSMFRWTPDGVESAVQAVIWFLWLNLLGLAFVAIRSVLLWVTAGSERLKDKDRTLPLTWK